MDLGHGPGECVPFERLVLMAALGQYSSELRRGDPGLQAGEETPLPPSACHAYPKCRRCDRRSLVVVRMAYKCRAYPAPEQARVLNRTFGCVRVVWNRTLAWRHARYDGEQVKTSFTQANAYLTAMKRDPDLAWLTEVPSVPLQQAIRHQQVAFTSFFARRARYPRFKSRTGRQSAEFTRSGFRYRDGALFLAKMGTPLAFAWSWPGIDPASINPSTVTVSRDPCGRWYVSFAVEVAGPEPLPATGAVAGIDLGIKDFAVTSGGTRSRTRGRWPAGHRLWPAISGAWPAARKAPRTGSRPGRRWPARTGRSARPAPISCTAPPRPWSAAMT